jgi:nucleoside-diphosphate-sugar epimerase
MARILLTGASGFLGRRFLELAPHGDSIAALWRGSADFPDFAASLGRKGVTPVRADLTDPADVARARGEIGEEWDALVVLAANGDPVRSESDPPADLRETALTAINTFGAFRAKKLVYFSSGAVYEGLEGPISPESVINPVLPYAVTHYAAERYAEYFTRRSRFGSAVAVRFFGAFGPHEPPRKIYTRLVERFAFEGANAMTIRGNGRNFIDAMFVDDAVAGIRRILDADAAAHPFEVYDFSSGMPVTINELVFRVAKVFGQSSVRVTYEGSVSEDHLFLSNPEPFRRRFGFTPRYGLEDGVLALREWLAEHPRARSRSGPEGGGN